MAGNHNSGPAQANFDRALAAWGEAMPEWVRMLAGACDRTSQRAVGDRIGRSNATVSKLINRVYPGSYEEAEMLVRARFGAEKVDCPAIGGAIPLAGCIRNRRRTDLPRNHLHHLWARNCPLCPQNTDREEDI